jgi:hypothetical protein
MQKKLKSFTLAASIFASLALVFVACGSGEITEYIKIQLDVDESERSFINKCVTDKADPECVGNLDSIPNPPPPPPPSSETPQSSEGGTSSSSQGSSTPSSSSQGSGTPSSSSQGSSTPSSSSSANNPPPPPPVSSSQGGAQQGCPSGTAKQGYKCGWDFKGTNLTPGTKIKPEKASGDDAGCTTKWMYKTGTSPLLRCSEMTSEGIVSEGDKAYILYAALECGGGTSYVNECDPTQANGGLTTKKAPYLDGECVWLSPGNDKPLASNETSVNKGAKPSGVKLVDSANVCKDKTIEVKYDNNSKVWKNMPDSPGTYADVQYTAKCAEYAVPTVICPSIVVSKSKPAEVVCVNKTGSFDCTMDDKTVNNSELKLNANSEGCMDLEINWQNASYPTGEQATKGLDIYIGCEYKGTNGTSKTCKLMSNGKELKSTTTTNDGCRLDNTSIGKVKGVSDQTFPKICMAVTDGGSAKDTGISCWTQVY